MASEIPDLSVELRSGTGKGAARQARRTGFVPGIVYGGGIDPMAIQIDFNYLLKRLNQGRFLSTLFNLKIAGQQDVRVICRSVQRHVVKDLPLHVDFMRLKDGSQINLFIPVRFINEQDSPGLRRGGVLTVVRGEIDLVVNAGNIPAEIVADISGLDVGDVVTISKIELPEGTRPRIADRDFVIANISAPSSLRSADEEEEIEEEETEDDNTEEE
ncbi:MAG: 50S ribosomal protein L25/general stress protein Ctc [Rhodobacteraceae bacterium]|nr:50S ribosomal protein L25/general stress protein Ctc [Paracoccaceae bacterium]MCY4195514.1 50S ribosomal protein L25/general stress protein Ctc [Paracoccaceae bacterium]